MARIGSLDKIKNIFDAQFSAWKIVLPATSLTRLLRGSIVKNGWTINFQYGRVDGVEYLEYFASHRMTNDTLHRIYADGREEQLGHAQEFYPVGDEKAEQAYYEHNRKFYALVKNKGLQ